MVINIGFNKKKLGVAVIGSGRIGTHRARLASLHSAVSYLVVGDINEEAAKKLADLTNASRYSTDALSLINDPRVDVVIVSTPEDAHAFAVEAAINAGKSVLVEKPLALTIEDGDKLANLAREKGVDLRIGYSQRFLQKYFVARDEISRGKIGPILGGMTRVYNTRTNMLAILKRCPEATPILDIITYNVDYIGWCLGPDVVPVEVQAMGHGTVFRDQGYDVDDISLTMVKYSTGAVFSFDICYALPGGFPTTGQSVRMEIMGRDGVVLIDDDHRDQILYTEHGYENAYAKDQKLNLAFLGSRSSGEWADGQMFGRIADETREWLDSQSTGAKCHLTTAEEARQTLKVTLAMGVASETGQPIPLANI
ncbi:MAG: Gfo/Idh/MocA family protein [Alphaproteobacteria bacterium]|jgi:predicted dehydrogenase|tara:strand:- start:19338 stop:20438 length:1101 start_codon:yes stop_codon:yes gene_type:complete